MLLILFIPADKYRKHKKTKTDKSITDNLIGTTLAIRVQCLTYRTILSNYRLPLINNKTPNITSRAPKIKNLMKK